MPFYFSDPNHEDRKYIEMLDKMLPDLVKLHGANTLFVEFLYIDTSKDDLESDFIECSGGRYSMKQPYLKLVKGAKALGLKVVGLTMPLYTQDMRRNVAAGFAFRAGGAFDVVVSEIIFQHAQDSNNYVVFLGAGHYRHLSEHIPSLKLIGDPDKDDDLQFTPLALAKAREWTEGLLDELMWKAVKLVVSNDGKESQLQVVTYCQRLPLDFPGNKTTLVMDWFRLNYPPTPQHRFDAIWKNFYRRTGSGKVLVLKLG
jgi:hypothetical protein